MVVGWVGLGKLGLPCALALSKHADVDVVAYDMSDRVREVVEGVRAPDWDEFGLDDLLLDNTLTLADSIGEVVSSADLVFVAVQTPHSSQYEGITPAPQEKRDFEYAYLRNAVSDVVAAAEDRDITVVVVSTCLPGTLDREIVPWLPSNVTLLYNPFFIAMGTTVRDFLQPEFVLVGCRNTRDADVLCDLYERLHDQPVIAMSYKSAELTKVAYNTFISMKIVFANALMELSHKIGSNVDAVSLALSLATDRVVSSKYMKGGMGDGGACHPRDNIAMSWLAERTDLSVDPFDFVTRAREQQSMWLARLVKRWHEQSGLPVCILGVAYKPQSDLTYGSPALLLQHQLAEIDVYAIARDGWVEKTEVLLDEPRVYVIGQAHVDVNLMTFPAGSVVIDVFGIVNVEAQQAGVTVIRVGRPL